MTTDNKVSHTPGPWDVLQDGDGNALKVTCERKYGGLVALASNWWYSTEIAEANARLIAAAPEMREMVEYLADSYCCFGGDSYPKTCPGDGESDTCTPCQARALLARIDGGNNA